MKLLVKVGLGAVALAGATVMLSSSVRANSLAHADFAAIQNLQARARAENDRIKLNCINDKLILAKAVLNMIDHGDNSKMAQLHELRVAAQACAGMSNMLTENSNSFTSPSGVSSPWGNPPDWGTTFEPPVNASPSMPTSPRAMSHSRFSFSYGRPYGASVSAGSHRR